MPKLVTAILPTAPTIWPHIARATAVIVIAVIAPTAVAAFHPKEACSRTIIRDCRQNDHYNKQQNALHWVLSLCEIPSNVISGSAEYDLGVRTGPL
jgi:hypothetical protein